MPWNCIYVVMRYPFIHKQKIVEKFDHARFQLDFEDNYNYVVFANDSRYPISKNKFGFVCVCESNHYFFFFIFVDEHVRQLHEDMDCNVNLYRSVNYYAWHSWAWMCCSVVSGAFCFHFVSFPSNAWYLCVGSFIVIVHTYSKTSQM